MESKIEVKNEDTSINGDIKTLTDCLKQMIHNNNLINKKHWSIKDRKKDNYLICQVITSVIKRLQENILKDIKLNN